MLDPWDRANTWGKIKIIAFGVLVVGFILFVSTGGLFMWVWDIWK